MSDSLDLYCLKIGEEGSVKQLKSSGRMRRRLLDIGLVENTSVQCLGRSPSGDPSAYLIRGAVIAIRKENCKEIMIQLAEKEETNGVNK